MVTVMIVESREKLRVFFLLKKRDAKQGPVRRTKTVL